MKRLLLLLIAAMVVAGCTPVQAGVAAFVGPVRITEAQVDSEAVTIGRLYHASADRIPVQFREGFADMAKPRTVLSDLVRSEGFRQLAEKSKVSVTDAQVDEFLQKMDQATLKQLKALFPEDSIARQVRTELLSQEIIKASGQQPGSQPEAAQLLGKLLKKDVPVKVNPRYGEWVPEGLQIIAAGQDLGQGAVNPVKPRFVTE